MNSNAQSGFCAQMQEGICEPAGRRGIRTEVSRSSALEALGLSNVMSRLRPSACLADTSPEMRPASLKALPMSIDLSLRSRSKSLGSRSEPTGAMLLSGRAMDGVPRWKVGPSTSASPTHRPFFEQSWGCGLWHGQSSRFLPEAEQTAQPAPSLWPCLPHEHCSWPQTSSTAQYISVGAWMGNRLQLQSSVSPAGLTSLFDA